MKLAYIVSLTPVLIYSTKATEMIVNDFLACLKQITGIDLNIGHVNYQFPTIFMEEHLDFDELDEAIDKCDPNKTATYLFEGSTIISDGYPEYTIQPISTLLNESPSILMNDEYGKRISDEDTGLHKRAGDVTFRWNGKRSSCSIDNSQAEIPEETERQSI